MTTLQDPHSLSFFRRLALGGGFAYLIWWGMVELTLPGSFNPIGSRLAAVAYCWGVFAATFFSARVARAPAQWFASCLWVVTGHYFYLFYYNQADINWVVGSYITVIAACACIHQQRELLRYSCWVVLLSIVLVYEDRALFKTIFLPGVFTILTFSYLALRARLLWLQRSIETTQWFRNLFDAAFEGVVVHERGVVIESNESFAKIFGYEPEELRGRDIIEFVALDERDFTQNQIDEMSNKPYRVTGLKKDGSTFPIEIRGKRHMVEGRTLRLAAVSDLTDRIQGEQERVLREATQHALRMREEFLSIASHELKTPLTNIKLQTQLTLRGIRKGVPGIFDPERIKKFVEVTDRQADRLTHLVDEMLDVSRIESGRLTFEWINFDLVELLNEVLMTFEASLEQSAMEVKVEAPSNCMVRADRRRMEQVISNLISNAIKYGNSQPIFIQVQQSESEISLMVKDHGIGIRGEDQNRIFQRFERAVSSHKISGLGLGLYIGLEIVEGHGGRIEVESQPEKGSSFKVVLPRQETL